MPSRPRTSTASREEPSPSILTSSAACRACRRDADQDSPDLLPPLVILLAVIGSIYAGLATATEAAALGILAALGYAAAEKRLSLKVLSEIFQGTARTTGMIMAIVIGA